MRELIILAVHLLVTFAKLCRPGSLLPLNDASPRTLPACGNLKIIAAIEEPAVIERILTHLGLCAQHRLVAACGLREIGRCDEMLQKTAGHS